MDEVMRGLKDLQLQEKAAISIATPEPDYILDLASQPGDGDGLLAVTSSNNTIRLYSGKTLATTTKLKGHGKYVSCVEFCHTEPNLLFSSSLDGTVRCWDTRTGKETQKYEGNGSEVEGFLSVSVRCDDHVICTGTEGEDGDTWILFWDRRKGRGELLQSYTESHQDDITQVEFHPSERHRLATGSTDGLINLFDTSHSDEDDALLTTLNTESSVSRIGWLGRSHDHIYGITHEETFHIWNAEDDIECEVKNFKDQFKSMEYIVDCFEDEDHQKHLVLGNHSGDVEVAQVQDDGRLHPTCSLHSAHTNTVRCIHYDTKRGSLITGGEDAMLCLWSPQTTTSKHKTKKSPKTSKDVYTSGSTDKRHSRTKPY